MRGKVIGMRNSAFTPKDSDKEIKGTTLYFTYTDEHVDGVVAEKQFVSDRVGVPAGVKVGSAIDLEYNKFGKVHAVHLIP